MNQENDMNDLMMSRREKLRNLLEKGVNPFGGKYNRTHTAKKINDEFGEFTKEALAEKVYPARIAGRVMTKRIKGKAGFAHIQDLSGKIQIYVRKDVVGDDQYELFDTIDIGDIVGVEGNIFRTNTGELSVKAHDFKILTKSLRPLPSRRSLLFPIHLKNPEHRSQRIKTKYTPIQLTGDF